MAAIMKLLGLDSVVETFVEIWRMDRRTLYRQVLNLMLVISSAIMIWQSLIVASGSESPVVVVLSGSMEPAFQRGDILMLWGDSLGPYRVGEVVVFKVKGRDIPIVHRILEIHEREEDGDIRILTKGDNNPVDDRGLYNPGQIWLAQEDIMGRSICFLPYLGMITIALTDYPLLKFALVGTMGIFVITSKEKVD